MNEIIPPHYALHEEEPWFGGKARGGPVIDVTAKQSETAIDTLEGKGEGKKSHKLCNLVTREHPPASNALPTLKSRLEKLFNENSETDTEEPENPSIDLQLFIDPSLTTQNNYGGYGRMMYDY